MLSEIGTFSPTQDKYLSAKVLGLILPLFYKKKGQVGVDLYTYLRWLDDSIDESNISTEEKLRFLNRQKVLILTGSLSENLYPAEELFLRIPWSELQEDEIKKQLVYVILSLQDDAKTNRMRPLSPHEARHANWRAVLPSLQILSYVVNQRPLHLTRELMYFIQHWTTLANLDDFSEDIEQEYLKLPVPYQVKKDINEADAAQKKDIYVEYYDPEKFSLLKKVSIQGMRENSNAFRSGGVLSWQAIACYLYIQQMLIKKRITVKYPKLY